MSMSLPRMIPVRQTFERTRVDDIPAETKRQLVALNLQSKLLPGQTVAITVGSRGVTNIAAITKAVCEHVRALNAVPIIIPAMGSHGGATASGQRQVIEDYGVTEDYTAAEIRSSMETVVVAETEQGVPVHFDKQAFGCDHLIVMGRIKPHTMFVGDIESGLHKMMLIGLGKQAGASIYHKAIKQFSFDEIIRSVATQVLKKCKVLCGVAIVENAYDETGQIEAVLPEQFYEREKSLLAQAKEWLPRLPFPEVDLLIIDRIGKNISGTGMDANIVGRKFNDHAGTDLDAARCKRILIRGLTEQTHGNACGIGLCEFTTQSVVDAIDMEATRVNCITAGHPTAAMIPITYATDREAIEAALQTVGLTPPEQARVVHITDTLHLETVSISEIHVPEIADRQDLQQMGEPAAMAFDSAGNLISLPHDA